MNDNIVMVNFSAQHQAPALDGKILAEATIDAINAFGEAEFCMALIEQDSIGMRLAA